MAEEPDGVNEAVEGNLTIALTVATRAAETLARVMADRAREAAAASEAGSRQLQGRLDAERDAARSSVAGVDTDQWWARAQPEQVAAAWQTVQTWQGIDPELAQAGRQIAGQVQARYGIDVAETQFGPGAIRQALAEQNTARAGPEDQRRRAGRGSGEAVALMVEADLAEADRQPGGAGAAEQDAVVAYDSPARREDLAAGLGKIAEPEVVSARMLADTAQAQPASAAVGTPAKTPGRARAVRAPLGRAAERVQTFSR